MKALAIVLFASFAVASTPVHAQDNDTEDAISDLVSALQALSYSDCMKVYDVRLADVTDRKPSTDPQAETLRLIAEGHRLACESVRLNETAANLTASHDRLLESAERLDEIWQIDHEAAPLKVRNYPGRDLSQKTMRSDAASIAKSVADLRSSAQAITDEAKRILELSTSVFAEMTADKQGIIEAKVDAEAQNEILLRLLGLTPKPKATGKA